MNIKKLLILVLTLFAGYALIAPKISASPNGVFRTIYHENFEQVTGALHDETIFWANHVTSGVKTTSPISGNKSLHFDFSDSIGNFVTLGGSSTNAIAISNDTYRISLDVKASDVDFLNIKIEQSSTWQTYHETIINPLTGDRINGNGDTIPIPEKEVISFNSETKVTSVSFVFQARSNPSSYLVLDAKVSGDTPQVIIDNVVIEKYMDDIEFKTTLENNFDNASGELYLTTIFWLNNDEGTTGGFTETPGEAINNRSLVYGVNKIGWDILGGSQGQKLTMKGGHTYKISFDLRLMDIAHFVLKIKKIDGDSMMTEMYINQHGKRLPGSIPIMNPEDISVNNGIINISFEFSSLIDDNAYIYLEANSLAVGGRVIIDNFKIEEELYDLSYHTYTIDHEIDFENVPNDIDPLLHFGLKNGSSQKTYQLIDDSPIRGEYSLKYTGLTRFQWNELLVTDSYQIINDAYKLHMKAIFNGISNVKLSLVDEDQMILHEMYFNSITLKRTQTFGKAYLDQGKLQFNTGKIYIDYIVPTLNPDTNYTWKLSVYPTTTTAFVVIDDLTFMTKAGEQIIDETLPVLPTPPESIDSTIPTGKDGSFYAASLLSGSSVGEIIFVSLISIFSLGLGGLAVFFVVKKVPIVAKKTITLSLISIISLGIPLGSIFGVLEFKQSIPKVLNQDVGHLKDYQYIYPEKLSGNLNNPGMGWVALEEPTYGGHPDMGTSGPLPEVSNISLSTSWARIEIEEGIYDWTLLDQIIDYYVPLGKRINFRIVTDSLMLPNTYSGTPQWLFDKYNIPYEVHNYTDPGPVRTYRVVDTRNEDYRRHLSLFLEALSEKYRDNDMIDVVEIRGWGNWGEWHSGYTYPTMDNRMNALVEIIDQYVDAFKETNKLLVLSAAWDPHHMPYQNYEDYYRWSAFDYLWRLNNTSFRRDSGGNLLNYPTDERLLSDAFRSGKRVPLLGEYASGIEQAYSEAFGFDLIGGIDDILFKMRPNHSTVLGWVNQNVARVVDDGNSILWERGNEKLGYRLHVDFARFPYQAKQGTQMDIMMSFSNTSLGRFWYKYPLKVALLDENNVEKFSYIDNNFDARTFVNGEITNFYTSMIIPSNLPKGDYHLAISIVNELGNPAIRMGMAGEIEDTMIYALGKINIDETNQTPKSIHQEMTFEEAKSFKFKEKTTYAITFAYTPHFDLSNYYFGDQNGYTFALTSNQGKAGATVGYTKWQDVSGEMGIKTIYATTHQFKDYKLNIESEGYGDIDIHYVKIETVNGYFEHFESYDFTSIDALYLPVSSLNVSLTKEKNIVGSQSILISSNRKGDSEAVKFDTSIYQLSPETAYTISFKFQSTALTGKGGYMFLNLIDEDTNQRSRVGEWYERSDRGMTTVTYHFITNQGVNQTLAWGIRNGGEYVIDDVILIKHPNGAVFEGIDYGHPQNVRPILNLKGLGETEGFEALSFNETAFDWGQFGWGQITYDPRYVITGNSSLMGQVEIEALDNEWFEFARSKPSAIQLKANTTYHIQFSYRILKNPINNGFFYILMRDLTVGLPSDVGFATLPIAAQNDLMVVKTFETTITTGNHQKYQFIFGMHMLGEIIIDDVIITEVTS